MAGFPYSNAYANRPIVTSNDPLLLMGEQLMEAWCGRLMMDQIQDRKNRSLHGGILCPACARIHGRITDTVYPLLFLADKKQDERYLQAAKDIFDWAENTVSSPKGYFKGDVNVSLWRGITVFAAISYVEALKYHGHVLDSKTLDKWRSRLKKAADFVYETFHIGYANVNYPVSGALALVLCGEQLEIPKYTAKGKELAKQCLSLFSKHDHFLYGEGPGRDYLSPKGCVPVDLGYNVEESLPYFLQYALFMNDSEVMEQTLVSMKSHLEFMMPDGGWDNSWGTRNYKWTYWGSRTTDGSAAMLAWLAKDDPVFYKAALRNTELLKSCTTDGYLHGGPHYAAHGIPPCNHHTFCHAKPMATLLNYHRERTPTDISSIKLPRETAYGVREFRDIYTWLISTEDWIATVTGYDREYHRRNGHATGGAVSVLSHRKAGLILVASMNEYSLWEPHNMQMNLDPFSMPLTPRLEQVVDGKRYMSISDLEAQVRWPRSNNPMVCTVSGRLVDAEQNDPPSGKIPFNLEYIFDKNVFTIKYKADAAQGTDVHFVLPVVSEHTEHFERELTNPAGIPDSDEKAHPSERATAAGQHRSADFRKLHLSKQDHSVEITSAKAMHVAPVLDSRVFNHVPGFQAIPIVIPGSENELNVAVVQR